MRKTRNETRREYVARVLHILCTREFGLGRVRARRLVVRAEKDPDLRAIVSRSYACDESVRSCAVALKSAAGSADHIHSGGKALAR